MSCNDACAHLSSSCFGAVTSFPFFFFFLIILFSFRCVPVFARWPSAPAALQEISGDWRARAHPTWIVCPNLSQPCNYVIFCSGFPLKRQSGLADRGMRKRALNVSVFSQHALLFCYLLITVKSFSVSAGLEVRRWWFLIFRNSLRNTFTSWMVLLNDFNDGTMCADDWIWSRTLKATHSLSQFSFWKIKPNKQWCTLNKLSGTVESGFGWGVKGVFVLDRKI